MSKRIIVPILVALIAVPLLGTVLNSRPADRMTLRDGFALAGVDGKLVSPDSNEADNKWFFELDSAISDGSAVLDAGAKLELLLSSTLEKMTEDAAKRSDKNYRLWARVTKYKGRNFIFPVYFLPVRKTSKPEPQQIKPSPQQTKPTINQPGDALTIPAEIVSKLTPRKIVRTKQLLKGLKLKTDHILADRTGFIRNSEHGTRETGYEFIFTLDAIGRNVQQISLRLLPCQVLQEARHQQSKETEQLRFKAAGIVTQHQGKNYLLLHRAVRVYSHENFSR